MRPHSVTAKKTDFLIFAPLDIEVRALREVFEITQEPDVMEDGSECYRFPFPVNGREISILIVQLRHIGVLGAAVMATKLIPEYRPWCLVSFGIAGGFVNTNKINKRDVFVPDCIFYYEPAKESVGSLTQSAPGSEQLEHYSESRVRPFLPSRDLDAHCRRIRPAAKRELKLNCVIGGPLASGEKKVADLDGPTVRLIKTINSGMLAIEMEAAGVGAAVDGWPELSPDCHFLVVKGISDDASRLEDTARDAKREETREAAARNAARFLRRIVETVQPKRMEKTPAIDISSLRSLSQAFLEALPSFVASPKPDELDVRRVLHPLDSLPPLLYHWRIDSALHWVDFAYLLVLKRLRDRVGRFPVHLLVTDLHAEEAARRNVQVVVEGMFGGEATVTWYSEILASKAEYVGHARKMGFDEEALQTVRNTRHILGLKKGNLISEEWVQYIVWSLREQERTPARAIVLVWKRMGRIYEQLLNAVEQDFLIIRGDDFVVGGKPGKFGSPAQQVFIEPPHYSSLLGWLNMQSDGGQRVAELTRYLVPFADEGDIAPSSDMEAKMAEMVRAYPKLCEVLANGKTTHSEAIRSLLAAATTWNQLWFGPRG